MARLGWAPKFQEMELIYFDRNTMLSAANGCFFAQVICRHKGVLEHAKRAHLNVRFVCILDIFSTYSSIIIMKSAVLSREGRWVCAKTNDV